MSLVEDVKLSAYWEATQSYLFVFLLLVFFFQNKNIVEELYYEGCTPEKSHEKSPNEFF